MNKYLLTSVQILCYDEHGTIIGVACNHPIRHKYSYYLIIHNQIGIDAIMSRDTTLHRKTIDNNTCKIRFYLN